MKRAGILSLRIVIVGGGAGGFFSALRAAEVAREKNVSAQIIILESSEQVLKKVKISGGGRCNVTHNCFDVRVLTQNYPRGQKELISPFQRFQPKDTIEWFKKRGVELKAEDDGRIFPITDRSQTIIQCFLNEAEAAGIQVIKENPVLSITKKEDVFHITTRNQVFEADRVILSTGSSQAGYRLAAELGHAITDLAPSLFSFKISDPLLTDLPGLSFENARVELQAPEFEKKFQQLGPILITHWGLSGPAILKLSAWAAREMKKSNYQANLKVNWSGASQYDSVYSDLVDLKEMNGKALVRSTPFKKLPLRFWQKLIEKLKFPEILKWSEVSKVQLKSLANELYATELKVLGQNRYKDEFVECGGVDLKEIDFKTMQSRKTKGLFIVGELLDIDGITGGFNFQNAWTGGYIAGESLFL